LIVLDGRNWSFSSALGSGPALRIVIKERSVSLYPVFHPSSIYSGQIPASLWVPGWGTYKRNILGAEVGTRKDLACIKFNS
jgi:hypothetical protein